MPRPLIGICAATERARWSTWDYPANLLPATYAAAIQRAGGITAMLPPDPQAAEDPAEVLNRFDALVVAGGADLDPDSHGAVPHPETSGSNPGRDRFEVALTRAALERGMPMLGICRGMQILNVARGGTLDQHLPERLGHERHRPVPGEWTEHGIRLEPGSLAARIAGRERLSVHSHHHQGVDRLGEGLSATGWSVDDDVIEAIELSENELALGVLWHPEEDPDDRILPWLVALASEGRRVS